jgi:hypothetical protein
MQDMYELEVLDGVGQATRTHNALLNAFVSVGDSALKIQDDIVDRALETKYIGDIVFKPLTNKVVGFGVLGLGVIFASKFGVYDQLIANDTPQIIAYPIQQAVNLLASFQLYWLLPWKNAVHEKNLDYGSTFGRYLFSRIFSQVPSFALFTLLSKFTGPDIANYSALALMTLINMRLSDTFVFNNRKIEDVLTRDWHKVLFR